MTVLHKLAVVAVDRNPIATHPATTGFTTAIPEMDLVHSEDMRVRPGQHPRRIAPQPTDFRKSS
ncbi:hypothetical protein [Nocardia violaceofusca]|uniref:hypothetical protein n=1 Tax=Nocardia violaceofusca TaxID=941182 RepID=UPI000B11E5D4|nr:hypothetical protein [Nocardia violaceofusca]